MEIIVFIITLFYCLLVGCFVIGFGKVERFVLLDLTEKTKFSIIIPFRNEADNLLDLLQSIYKLEYPKHLFEVLLIDDASEDNSVEIIEKILNTKFSKENSSRTNIQILKNKRVSNSPKKDAITTAMQIAKNEWIITTDADCVTPKLWLKTLDKFIQTNNPEMIVAPVTYSIGSSFFEHFQLLDFFSLQSATIAGFGIKKPFLCNGANLTYKKELFKKLNGFDGNTKIASGDDIFLMEKALQIHANNVMYLKSKSALITTKPQPSLKDLVQQRLRWAAKTTLYNNSFSKLVGLSVLFMNGTIIVSTFLTIIGVLLLEILILIFVLKYFFDLFLIRKYSRFVNQKLSLTFYTFSAILYPLFSVSIAVFSIFFGFKWKGRGFKK